MITDVQSLAWIRPLVENAQHLPAFMPSGLLPVGRLALRRDSQGKLDAVRPPQQQLHARSLDPKCSDPLRTLEPVSVEANVESYALKDSDPLWTDARVPSYAADARPPSELRVLG